MQICIPFFQKLFQGKRPHVNGHDIREGFHYRPPSTFLRQKRRCHRPWRPRCVGGVFRGDLWLIVYLRNFSFCHFAGKRDGKECSTILWWWLESWYTFSQMPLPRKFRWGVFKALEAESMMNIWSNQGYIGEALSVPFGNASQYWHVFVYCICLAVCLLVHLCIYLFVCMSASLFVCLAKYLFPLFSISVVYSVNIPTFTPSEAPDPKHRSRFNFRTLWSSLFLLEVAPCLSERSHDTDPRVAAAAVRQLRLGWRHGKSHQCWSTDWCYIWCYITPGCVKEGPF